VVSIIDKSVVLFDLGGTLINYFERNQFHNILKQGITAVQNFLSEKGFLKITPPLIWMRVEKENYESKNHVVRPLEKRLARIFQVNSLELLNEMCRRFMQPIFSLGQCYRDTVPVLNNLKNKGFITGIISNTTWGSPAYLWREETERLGLDKLVNAIVFCRDVGWRKPAKKIFQHTLKKLNVNANECVFIGDHPEWDIKGPKTVGIKTVLIDRKEVFKDNEQSIKNLYELLNRMIIG
jgi:putative hydrolase of the HAD superfamily